MSGVLGGLALLLVSRWPQTVSSGATSGLWSQLRGTAVEMLTDTPVLVTSLAQASQFFVHGTVNAFLPLYAHEVLRLPPAWIGWLFGLQTAATLAARPLLGVLSDRAAGDRSS